MPVTSKFVALKNYIPTGLPKETDFEIKTKEISLDTKNNICLLYTSPSPRDLSTSRMPSSA